MSIPIRPARDSVPPAPAARPARRRIVGGLASAALATSLAAPAAADWSVTLLDPGFPVAELKVEPYYVGPRLWFLAEGCRRTLRLDPVAEWEPAAKADYPALSGHAAARDERPAHLCDEARVMAAHGRVAPIPQARIQWSAAPEFAYLASPTSAHAHGVLGDAIEAETVVVGFSGGCPPGSRAGSCGRTALVPAGPGAVFEDTIVRKARFDASGPAVDGRRRADPARSIGTVLLVVKSYLDRGSALAVIGRAGDDWSIVAETPPIGTPGHWLAPAGVADFDGDGRPDVALVVRPHFDGLLQVWTWDADGPGRGRLGLKFERAGYANHAAGSPLVDNAAVRHRAGAPPLLEIPTRERDALALLSLKDDVVETARIALPGEVARGLTTFGRHGADGLVAVLEDGRVAVIRP